jgi:beta-glucanase (GH16 family)
MFPQKFQFALTALSLTTLCLPAIQAQEAESKVLLEMSEGVEKRVSPTSPQVNVARSQDNGAAGLNVTVASGPSAYPGLNIKPEAGVWDLSKYGRVEARITNTSDQLLSINLRVDNAGDWKNSPWNTEALRLKAGESGVVKTIFGYTNGFKAGYPLKSEAVANILLFTGKTDIARSFRIDSLIATGVTGEAPPTVPAAIRIKPANGFLFGGDTSIDLKTQISAKGAQVSLAEGESPALKVVFPAVKGEQTFALKPAQGRWDLRDYLEVRVKLKNDGQNPLTPRVRVDSNGGSSKWFSTTAPLAAGAEAEIVVPFDNNEVVDLENEETRKRVSSNTVSGVKFDTEAADNERVISVQSIRAVLPPAPVLPAWVGNKPPVDGDWTQTLNENFDGTTVNSTLWNIYTSNFWDKRTHTSKDDTIIKDGVAILRVEKKRGFDWDDPTRKETDYAMGFLDTYGKWTQRYGYFEARMKLPTAPGLWPAFWMMPDRGEAAGPEQWKRADTKNGGMEFDVMEHLTGWGKNRYNVANHWNGYGKDHKASGSQNIYVQPDKDGFITSGVLWTPGSLVYYGNGKELVRWENERISNVPANLILYMVTGGWDNLPLDDAQLPADFVIDYVRAWQRKDLASDLDKNKQTAQ